MICKKFLTQARKIAIKVVYDVYVRGYIYIYLLILIVLATDDTLIVVCMYVETHFDGEGKHSNLSTRTTTLLAQRQMRHSSFPRFAGVGV